MLLALHKRMSLVVSFDESGILQAIGVSVSLYRQSGTLGSLFQGFGYLDTGNRDSKSYASLCGNSYAKA
jgi:hypothetical protein